MGQVREQIHAFACEAVEVGMIPPKHRVDLHAQLIRRFDAGNCARSLPLGGFGEMNDLDYDNYCRPALSANKRHRLRMATLFSGDRKLKESTARLALGRP